MRILDTTHNTSIKNIILYLRIEEAKELCDSVSMLLDKSDFNDHVHVDDASFDHGVTVVLYDEKHMDSLNERSKKIILKDI